MALSSSFVDSFACVEVVHFRHMLGLYDVLPSPLELPAKRDRIRVTSVAVSTTYESRLRKKKRREEDESSSRRS